MKILIFVVLLGLATSAHSGWFYGDGEGSIKLTDIPCIDKGALASVNPDYHNEMFVLESRKKGVSEVRYGCYNKVDMDKGLLWGVSPAGTVFRLPSEAFKKDLGV